jgi:hypothetical protein
MAEWELAQTDPADELAQLHFFSVKKKQPEGEIEFRITIREFANRRDNRSMQFFAEADKQTNQSIAPYAPVGWGSTLGKALSECVRAIQRFPYEGPMPSGDKPAS